MKIIAHRGNVHGPNLQSENKPDTIMNALKMGFDAEIDIHVLRDKIFLGHDKPQYEIPFTFLTANKDRLWIHCKNKEALALMSKTDLHYFWHQSDTYTLTSKGIIWTYVGAELINGGVCVLPQQHQNVSECYGVCTDYPLLFMD